MNNSSTTGGFGSGDWLLSAVKKNPEGLLLLAAGCALLLRTGGTRARQSSDQYRSYSSGSGHTPQTQSDAERGQDWKMSEGMSRAADSARDAADSARQYASDVAKTASETADKYVSRVGEYADEARRTIVDHSGRIAEQAQSTIEGIVLKQPLAVAIAGLAAGAAVAAAFPSTRMERQALGPAGKRLSEVATTAGERVSEAGAAVGKRLMSVADEKGLNTEGLKEVARDVAGTFEKSLTSAQQDDRNAGKRDAGSVQPGTGPTRSGPSESPAQSNSLTQGAGTFGKSFAGEQQDRNSTGTQPGGGPTRTGSSGSSAQSNSSARGAGARLEPNTSPGSRQK